MQQLKQKKIPVRRCVGCNAQRPKRELVRVVRSPCLLYTSARAGGLFFGGVASPLGGSCQRPRSLTDEGKVRCGSQ